MNNSIISFAGSFFDYSTHDIVMHIQYSDSLLSSHLIRSFAIAFMFKHFYLVTKDPELLCSDKQNSRHYMERTNIDIW